MGCAISEERLWSWVDRDAPELHEHARECERCRGLAGAIREHILRFANEAAAPQRVPARVASFTVLRLLGEGGQGQVFEAEQDVVGRRVALKVLKGGCRLSAAELRAFRREIDTLARLQHRNIATLYEAGQTSDGRYYFAMELVEGALLREHLEQQRPSMRERIALFRRICDPVIYAHERGVIHRDLKPGNILVDRSGEPRVLDFGLAQIADSERTITFSLNADGRIHGTLPYMSPEQACGRLAQIDQRTDVYSLGVTLYEMLTGRLPYETLEAPPHLALRAICEDAPTRPRSINRALPADLETIMLTALEKDPARRYATAAALASDLDRFLRGDAILARRPSAVYQLRKLVARHKLPVTLGSLLVAAVGVFVGVASVQAARLIRERDRATVAEAVKASARRSVVRLSRRVDAEEQRARRAADFLEGVLASADPLHARKSALTLRDLLAHAQTQLAQARGDDPGLESALRAILGRTYADLLMTREAEPLLRAALAQRQALHGGDHVEVAESLADLADLLERVGAFGEAVPLRDAAMGMRARLFGGEDARVVRSRIGLSESLRRAGQAPRAFDEAQAALDAARRNANPELLNEALDQLAAVHESRGEGATAEALLRQTLQLRQSSAGPRELALSWRRLAEFLRRAGRLPEAAQAMQEGLRVLAEAGPDQVANQLLLSQNLARIWQEAGAHEAALETLQRAVRLADENLPAWHYVRLCCRRQLGECLAQLGRFEQAEASLLTYYWGCFDLLGPDDDGTLAAREKLAALYDAWGRADLAAVTRERGPAPPNGAPPGAYANSAAPRPSDDQTPATPVTETN